MFASKLFVSALVTVLALVFLQIDVIPSWAGRGCKMGADCQYNAQGHGASHQARAPIKKTKTK